MATPEEISRRMRSNAQRRGPSSNNTAAEDTWDFAPMTFPSQPTNDLTFPGRTVRNYRAPYGGDNFMGGVATMGGNPQSQQYAGIGYGGGPTAGNFNMGGEIPGGGFNPVGNQVMGGGQFMPGDAGVSGLNLGPTKGENYSNFNKYGETGGTGQNNPGDIPAAEGNWLDYGQFGLGVANVGLGVWGALEASKMNSFMRDYYSGQEDLQRADFANAARSTNQSISDREMMRQSAAGNRFGSGASENAVSASMDKWGVDETF